MAPISVKGVTDTGWPCSAMVISPLAISTSKRRGEFTLMMVVTPGEAAIASRLSPRLMAIIRIPSSARPRPIEVQWYDRSDRTRLARYASRWRVLAGSSMGATTWLPMMWMALK